MAATDVRITTLVDNDIVGRTDGGHSQAGLVSEHGLSMWIEADGIDILMDTGQGPSLENNARALGIDLAKTDALVLSHGHYDHTGGIPQALSHAERATVYCHPAVMRTRYSTADGSRPIGMPEQSRDTLRSLPAGRINWVLGPVMLSDNIGLTGPVPRVNSFEDTGGPFFMDESGWRPDPIEDDMALWIRTDKGLVVCLGCAHAGVVNTLDYLRSLQPGETILAVVGGMHLMNASSARIQSTGEALRSLAPSVVIPCHCTGTQAMQALRGAVGGVSSGGSGLVLEF